MKRFYQLLAVAAVALFVPVAVSTPVSAAFKCEVGFTGPDSNNMCTSEEVYTCSVNSANNVTITNSSNQEAYSGEVAVGDNNSGGDATSGSVTNNNNTTFSVKIDNGQTCKVTAAVVPATETPEEPEAPTPGRGEAEAPVQPTQTATPAVLPTTSGSNVPLALTLVGSATLTVGVALAYRRLLS